MNQQGPEPGHDPGQPYQPPPGYGQQPGYSQQPGYGPPPGYSEQPGYGPPPGYSQQPGYGPPYPGQSQPPGYGPPYPGQSQPPPSPPPEKGGSGRIVAVLVVLALVLGGGGYFLYRTLAGGASTDQSAAPAESAPSDSAPTDEPDPGDGTNPGLPQTAVEACPFTAAQVTAMLGRPMIDSGDCLFGDGTGVAQLNIEVHSAASTEVTYDYSRAQAQSQYGQVDNVQSGDKGFVAYKSTACEAVVIKPRAGYTITMSNFDGLDGIQYEQPMRNIISALPN